MMKLFGYVFPILLTTLIYSIIVAAIIILIFSIIYYKSSSSLSFDNCTIFSTKVFFSYVDYDKYPLNGICKYCSYIENLLYDVVYVILIGVLLTKINEDEKDRKLEPIRNKAYEEIYTLSKIISHYMAEILCYKILIVSTSDEENEETFDEKIDKAAADFIKNTKLDSIDNIIVKEIKDGEIIKFEIKEYEITKFKIIKSRFKNSKLEDRLKSRYIELSILQMKYQQYIEPEITTNTIEIQENLNLAEKTISAYNLLPGNKDNQCNCIKYVVFYLLKAAEFSQEASKQSKSRIKTSGNE